MADAPEQPLVAADGDQALLKCDRCALPVPETDLSAKKATHSKLTECKSCRSLMSWLAYHVSPSEVFNKMSTEEVTDFFQRALDERKETWGSPQACSGALQLVEALPEEDRRREQALSWRHLPSIEELAAENNVELLVSASQ